MDQKKQNLTPELKEIYDRVMNTQVQNAPGTPMNGNDAAKTPPIPENHPQNTMTAPAAPQPSPVPNPSPVPPPPPPAAAQPAQPTQPATNATSNPAAPNPIGKNSNFVFTGNKMTTPAGTATVQVNSGGKKISGMVIVGLVLVLLAVWAVFWAKIFGLF